METKICTQCKLNKSISEFYFCNPGRQRTQCRKCLIKKISKWKNNNTKLVRATRIKYNRLHPGVIKKNGIKHKLKKFGLTEILFNELKKKQNNLCRICKKLNIRGRELAIDHDHKTGKVRGLLCTNCNLTLGLIKDDIEILNKMIVYLLGQNLTNA